jgi:signal transduction histidine kinase
VTHDDASFSGDEERLVQLAVHQLANAITYSPPGGTVAVAASGAGAHVEVAIRDEGCGLATEYHQVAFERFWQAQSPTGAPAHGQGFGLGLAIAKAIVEQHQGTIGLASEPGDGTTAWFRLPARPNRWRYLDPS